MKNTKMQLDLAMDTSPPRTPSRLRTQLRAGGLLDEPMRLPRDPARGTDGESRRPLRTGVTAGSEEGYTGAYSWNDNDYCGMALGLSNLKLIN